MLKEEWNTNEIQEGTILNVTNSPSESNTLLKLNIDSEFMKSYTFTINNNGKRLFQLDRDGNAEIFGDVNEAAKIFIDNVKTLFDNRIIELETELNEWKSIVEPLKKEVEYLTNQVTSLEDYKFKYEGLSR